MSIESGVLTILCYSTQWKHVNMAGVFPPPWKVLTIHVGPTQSHGLAQAIILSIILSTHRKQYVEAIAHVAYYRLRRCVIS